MNYKNVFQRKREKQKATSPILKKRIYALQLALLGTLIISALSVLPNTVQYARANEDVGTIPTGEWTGLGMNPDTTSDAHFCDITHETNQEWAKCLIHVSAQKWGLNTKDENDMFLTFQHESGNFVDPCIQASFVGTKGRELSFGFIQLHLSSHEGITKEMACTPSWAIEWAASNWQKHKEAWWSSYRLLRDKGVIK